MKKNAKGFTLVELLVVIAILGILMATLVPKVMDVFSKTSMQTTAKQGADIVNAINIKSMDAARGGVEIWPLVKQEDCSDDQNDIAGNTYGSSTEYFKKLFDVEKQTQGDKWRPYINVKIDFLWGNGVPAAKAGNLTKDNVAWTIVGGVNASTDVRIPALVTRNVDVSKFVVQGTQDMSAKNDEIDLGTKFPTPFGKKGAIFVNKEGGAVVREARECRLSDIYNRSTITIPEGIQLQYLEPQ